MTGEYCHDPEIDEEARRIGVKDKRAINNAKSMGEGPYNALDAALLFLARIREASKKNKQPKTRKSDREKREILRRHGQ